VALKDFFKTRAPQYDPDKHLTGIMNRTPADKNMHFSPPPSAAVTAAYQRAEDIRSVSVSGRYTLNPGIRTKILDTQGKQMDVYITVPGNGTTAYITHDPIRVLSISSGLHEGIPLSNNPSVQGRPTANWLKWIGEMWASGDTANMIIDVEAS